MIYIKGLILFCVQQVVIVIPFISIKSLGEYLSQTAVFITNLLLLINRFFSVADTFNQLITVVTIEFLKWGVVQLATHF